MFMVRRPWELNVLVTENMFLSGAMMLYWLGDWESVAEGRSAANLIRRAVESALRIVQPIEIGGSAGTAAITKTVLDAVVSLPLEVPGMSGFRCGHCPRADYQGKLLLLLFFGSLKMVESFKKRLRNIESDRVARRGIREIGGAITGNFAQLTGIRNWLEPSLIANDREVVAARSMSPN
jgi:hypothetical protein